MKTHRDTGYNKIVINLQLKMLFISYTAKPFEILDSRLDCDCHIQQETVFKSFWLFFVLIAVYV